MPWAICINWDAVAAISTAIAAIGAAIAAFASLSQLRESERQAKRKRDDERRLRAFDFSAAASLRFGEAWSSLSNSFGDWSSTERIDAKSAQSLISGFPEIKDDFNYVLNHFGRMASAVYYDVIDEVVAKNLVGYRFCGFWRRFESFFELQFELNPNLRKLYKNTIKLYENWSPDFPPSAKGMDSD
ncbi:MAG: hypothetical protein KKH72_00700 [Alphaproteobacteria bacterium]|nr:hypothetical protein [Alphaproteobacteria bacterium]